LVFLVARMTFSVADAHVHRDDDSRTVFEARAFSDDELVDLARTLRRNPREAQLELCHLQDIGPDGLKALSELVGANSVITRLELSYCQIGKEAEKELAQALEVNTSIKELKMFETNMTDMFWINLAAVLRRNSTLESLQVRSDRSKKCKEFFDALKDSMTIAKLTLFRCELADDELEWLFDALRFNTSIKELGVYDGVNHDGLATALRANMNTAVTRVSRANELSAELNQRRAEVHGYIMRALVPNLQLGGELLPECLLTHVQDCLYRIQPATRRTMIPLHKTCVTPMQNTPS